MCVEVPQRKQKNIQNHYHIAIGIGIYIRHVKYYFDAQGTFEHLFSLAAKQSISKQHMHFENLSASKSLLTLRFRSGSLKWFCLRMFSQKLTSILTSCFIGFYDIIYAVNCFLLILNCGKKLYMV